MISLLAIAALVLLVARPPAPLAAYKARQRDFARHARAVRYGRHS